MAERPAVKVQQIGRDKLALFLPNREAIKAFEHLVADVATVLPDAALANATAAEAAQADADAAQEDANSALARLVLLQAEVDAIQSDLTALTARVAELEAAIMFVPALQYDYIDATTSYRGEAEPGTATSAALWRVQRITITGDDLVIEWADGSADFTQVWDDRLSLIYS